MRAYKDFLLTALFQSLTTVLFDVGIVTLVFCLRLFTFFVLDKNELS